MQGGNKYLVLDQGAEPVRSHYEPDVETLLSDPKQLLTASRARLSRRFSDGKIPLLLFHEPARQYD